ncbi:MAG: indolepyruvate ferredoxin oxidoreductase family protein [Gammaproteobacteria bacterium]|nr:indolepyruvate ferredoxin oxidoreductase family protein [Gammaproteobacteria bacterium]
MLAPTQPQVTDLFECYRQTSGRVYMNGQQALARIILEQMRFDQQQQLHTGAMISGYRGSPLGNIDNTLHQAKPFFEAANVQFQPAVNEDLAATMIWGSQQSQLSPQANTDGVVGMWYGKGPGVDRCGDVFKHANAAGTSQHGGVLCVAGDDHGAKSSTVPHQSDHAFMSALMPMLYPSSIHEYLWLGLAGIAMSRYSGCWVGFKVISETVETTASVDLDGLSSHFILPTDFQLPEDGLNLRWPDDRWQQDQRLQEHKAYAALAFARANKLDRITLRSPHARFGIITSGKAYEDTRQALLELGLNNPTAAKLGISVYKVAMPWPLEPFGVREFSRNLEEIMVIEERREVIENQIKQHLFNWGAERPRITGKFDDMDQPILPLAAELNVVSIALALAHRLLKLAMDEDTHLHLTQQIKRLTQQQQQTIQAPAERTPFFCAGCPHNASTKVPAGSRASAGIGCHYMVTWMNRNTQTFTHMGGEGVPWLACSRFTDEPHQFVNLGDGTYFHSGSLAIRQALASKANITYKILYNDAVAMTGGQQVDGHLSVPRMSRQLHAEGVERIYLLSDAPDQYKDQNLAPGVYVGHRDELEQTMLKLRQIQGVSVIIYHQACATEKRRQRRRGKLAQAEQRLWIHPEICDGCGHCSQQSNCIAIEPLPTQEGRKRQINQSMCNSDLTCLKGFCPAFISLHGAQLKRPSTNSLPHGELPEPATFDLDKGPCNIAVTGVGGMGVVTIGALLGMAAHLDNKAFMTLDFSGLAQKGGAVVSHIRIALKPEQVTTARIIAGLAHTIIGADTVVTAGHNVLSLCASETQGVISTHPIPTANFIHHPEADSNHQQCLDLIAKHTHSNSAFIDFHKLAVKYLGDAIYANTMMLGYALQRGLLPVSASAIKEAINLNGVSIENNLQALQLGRYIAHHGEPDTQSETLNIEALVSLQDVLQEENERLISYQNHALAKHFQNQMHGWTAALESRLSHTQSHNLLKQIAGHYSRLLRNKDEYEVARLLGQSKWQQHLRNHFDGSTKISLNLSPLGMAGWNKWLQQPKKYAIGSWLLKFMPLLASMRHLRGGAFDLYARHPERRAESAFVTFFVEQMQQLCQQITSDNFADWQDLLQLFDKARGYGHIRQKNMQSVTQQVGNLKTKIANQELGVEVNSSYP